MRQLISIAQPGGAPRLARIVGVALFVSLLLAACGGGGLSKEEYIAQADEICAEAEQRVAEAPQPTDPAQAESYANELEAITEGYIAELRELEPPEDDAEEIEQLITMIEQAGLNIVQAIRTQSSSGSPAEAYSEALHLAEEANEQAEEYGFESCGISEILEHDDH